MAGASTPGSRGVVALLLGSARSRIRRFYRMASSCIAHNIQSFTHLTRRVMLAVKNARMHVLVRTRTAQPSSLSLFGGPSAAPAVSWSEGSAAIPEHAPTMLAARPIRGAGAAMRRNPKTRWTVRWRSGLWRRSGSPCVTGFSTGGCLPLVPTLSAMGRRSGPRWTRPVRSTRGKNLDRARGCVKARVGCQERMS